MSHTEIIAHRGVPRERRENTVEGFDRAIALGADAIELDVHGTRDRVLVVHHDALVRGVKNGAPAAIAELSLSALRDTSHGDPAIPTLAEVLDRVRARVRVYVEVKAAGVEDEVAALLRDRTDWTAVHSFDHRIVARIHQRLPSVPAGVLLVSRLVDPTLAMQAVGARDLWQQWEMVDADLVREVHRTNGRVIAWTVNDLSVARRLADLGVDAICTDVCGELAVRG